MRMFVCSVCGYVYDEAKGNPENGAAPGTRWEDLPVGWVCPICGASKSEFREQGVSKPVAQPMAALKIDEDSGELTPLETSILCSNLARGCEKQYKPEEAALFTQLAAFFKSANPLAEKAEEGELLSLVEKDLESGLPAAHQAAADAADRGALRALVWNEKVTRILKSLLTRYQQEGEAMLAHTGVYVCTICGFVYVGDQPPELCPVCKVPSWKFEKIEGRAQ